MALTCPDCSAQLAVDSFKGMPLEVCPSCQGMWFKEDELKEFLQNDPNSLQELSQAQFPKAERKTGTGTHNCPDCAGLLRPYHYMYNSPAMLKQCDNCGGFWVRHDDLQKMQEVFRGTKAPMTELEKDAASAAQDITKHDAFMAHQSGLQDMFNFMNFHLNGWYL